MFNNLMEFTNHLEERWGKEWEEWRLCIKPTKQQSEYMENYGMKVTEKKYYKEGQGRKVLRTEKSVQDLGVQKGSCVIQCKEVPFRNLEQVWWDYKWQEYREQREA